MIIQEIYKDRFIKTYSDEGYYIIQTQTGNKYSEAIDLPGRYTYIESNENIEGDIEDGNE